MAGLLIRYSGCWGPAWPSWSTGRGGGHGRRRRSSYFLALGSRGPPAESWRFNGRYEFSCTSVGSGSIGLVESLQFVGDHLERLKGHLLGQAFDLHLWVWCPGRVPDREIANLGRRTAGLALRDRRVTTHAWTDDGVGSNHEVALKRTLPVECRVAECDANRRCAGAAVVGLLDVREDSHQLSSLQVHIDGRRAEAPSDLGGSVG